MRWLFLLLLGCGKDPNAGSVDSTSANSSNDGTGSLQLVIEEPARGSFESSVSGVVRGWTRPGEAPLSSLVINGEEVSIDNDGSFANAMNWEPGIQILGVQAEDEEGNRVTDGRAFYAGPVNEAGAWLPGAIRMEIDPEIIDDDEPDLDDLASLIEALLNDKTILEPAIGVEVDVETLLLTPTVLDYDQAEIDFIAGDGVVYLEVEITNLTLAFDAAGVGVYSWLSTEGEAWASDARLVVQLSISTQDGIVHSEPTSVEVMLYDFGFTLEYVPDFLEETIADWSVEAVEDLFAEVVMEYLVDEVSRVLESFAIEADLGENMKMKLRLASIEVVPEGIRFVADAMMEATNGIQIPVNAGSLKTADEPPEWPLNEGAHFGAAIDDDLLNQIGFAFWRTGEIQDVSMSGVIVGGLSGGPIEEPLGPVENVTMSLSLPPVVTPSVDDEWDAQLSAGEWNLAFEQTDGDVLEFSVSVRSHIEVDPDDDDSINLVIDDRLSQMTLEIGALDVPDDLDVEELKTLVRERVPSLLRNAPNFAPPIPVPVFQLQEFVDVPATEDLSVVIDNPIADVSEAGWLLLQADLAVE